MTAPLTAEQKRARLAALLRAKADAQAVREGALSHGEQALWLLHRAAPASAAYHFGLALRIRSPLDADALAVAFQGLVERHPQLRTGYVETEGRPTRHRAAARSPLQVVDAAGWDAAALHAAVLDTYRAPFDLAAPPLLRVRLFCCGAADHVLLLCAHHIVWDGRSLWRLLDDLRDLYWAAAEGQRTHLPAPARDYTDFVRWQADLLAAPRGEALWQYWRDRLAGALPALDLPTDRSRPASASLMGASCPLPLSPELSARLLALARRQGGASTHQLFAAAFAAFLSAWSGQDSVMLGTATAGRAEAAFADTVGYFVNPVAVRVELGHDPSFAALLAAVRADLLGALEHAEYPFPLLVERLRPPRAAGRSPVFQAFLSYQGLQQAGPLGEVLAGADVAATAEWAGLRLCPYPLPQQEGQFELTLEVVETAARCYATLKYATDLFDAAGAAAMAAAFADLLENLADAPLVALSRLDLLAPARLPALARHNATAHDFADARAVHQMVAAQARATPDRAALSFGGATMSYAELDARATRLAGHLVARGVRPDERVGVCLDRSFALLVAVLAVLKAGAAFLPLEPELPPQRRLWMLQAAGARLVIARGALGEGAPDWIDPALADGSEPPAALAERWDSDGLAYVIFTSGSTGRPKGAAISHAALRNRLLWMQDAYRLTPDDVVLQKTPIGFDVSVWELLWPLMAGARLAIAEPGLHRDPAGLAACLAREAVTTLHFVPSMLRQFLAEPALPPLPALRLIFCSGEALAPDLRDVCLARLPAALHNLYGPTEAAIDVTAWSCARGDARPLVPIGRPIANTAMHIVDRHMRPVPDGMAGELCIAGANLGRGYVGQPGLTAEHFVPDPAAPGRRMYRTGDRARRLPDGSIAYLGRLDHQVKLRGVRIEIGEIEHALRRHPAIADAAVAMVDTPPADPELVAYVTLAPSMAAPGTAAPDDLRSFLARTLPAAMLPARTIVLPALPLTASGKLERQRLPPATAAAPAAAEPVRGLTEELLAALCADLLGLSAPPGRDADFFGLGGHSLLAARLVNAVVAVFGPVISVSDVFEAPLIAALASRIDAARGLAPADPIRPAERPLLSFGQRRLWLLDQLEGAGAAYLMPGWVDLTGPLDPAALAGALRCVLHRHPPLRATVALDGAEPVMRWLPADAVMLTTLRFDHLDADAAEAALAAATREAARLPFDLAAEPPLRARLVQLAPERHRLLLTLHHIAADGWSIDLLVAELSEAYNAIRAGRAPALPALPVSYADHAASQQARERRGALEDGLAFWTRLLEDAPQAIDLPTDRPRPSERDYRGASEAFRIEPDVVAGLRGLARAGGATLFMVCLAAFAILLSRHGAGADIVVGTPVAGRDRKETEPLIGLFMNLLPLRLDLGGEPTLAKLLRRLRTRLLEAWRYADTPFDLLLGRAGAGRTPRHPPLFQVLFVFQNAQMRGFTFDGLSAAQHASETDIAKYELTLELTDTGGALQGRLEYSTALFDRATVVRLRDSLQTLLAAMPEAADRRIGGLPILPPAAWQEVVRTCNATEMPLPLPRVRCVQDVIAIQAERTPDAVAVIAGSTQLSYRALLQRGCGLALRLRALGVTADRPVALLLPRSEAMPVGMLGVLCAGAAFLPLDTRHPPQRQAQIVRDAGADVVVAQGATLAAAARLPAVLVDLDEITDADAGAWAAMPQDWGDEALAYILYTSGSTGGPKGVEVEHRQLLNFFAAMDRLLAPGPANRPPGVWLAVTAMTFDIALLELLWTLQAGWRVVIQGDPDSYFDAPLPSPGRGLAVSLCFFGNAPQPGSTDNPYALLLAAARFADLHGFAAIWTPERHFHAFGGLFPNPALTSAALAAVTTRIAIRAGSVVLPLHDPLRVAEDWAQLDQLSGGRVGVSVASGWHADDFTLAPDRYADRKGLMVEGIDTLRRLWRGESVERRNGLGQMVYVAPLPRPLQPDLPLWLTAAGSADTFRIAGELGCGVLTHLLGQSVAALASKIAVYRAAWQAASHAGTPHVTLMIHTLLGEDADEVMARVRGPFRDYLRTSFDLIGGLARELGIAADPAALSPEDEAALLDHAFARFASANALFGTPDSVRPLLHEIAAAGVDELACLIDFGAPAAEALAGLVPLDRVRCEWAAACAPEATSLPALLRQHGVTHLQCTPTLARLLTDRPGLLSAAPLTLLVGGEALPGPLAETLAQQVSGPLWNMYGPTETTIWSSAGRVIADDPLPGIGRPLANTQIYVLDAAMEPVPLGVTGEIYIGGDGVARGYRGRPAATAERFVPDPFAQRPGARLHRTGDLGRRRADGSLDILGRRDRQIKLRGFRLDLGEVEDHLLRHPDVTQAVASLRDGDLAAYVTLRQPAEPASPGEERAAELRRHLQQTLPDHAVPRTIVVVESFALTASGKLDRRALPALPPPSPSSPVPAAVASPEAELVAAVWCRVLGRDRVGHDEDFFLAGGNSLLAIQAAMLLRDAFGVDIPVRLLFEATTVSALAARLAALRGAPGGPPPIRRRASDVRLPLSFAQQRLWFLDALEGRSASYSMPGALRLDGTLDAAALAAALGEIVRRHETLRTRFRQIDAMPWQIVLPPEPIKLPVIDLAATPRDAQAGEVARLARLEAARPFDLAHDLMLRATLLRLDATTHVLLLTMHHIVSDGWSLGVLVEELSALYRAFVRGAPSPLPELPVQYGDFTIWQHDWLRGTVLDRHLAFWRAQLEGAPPLLELPTDRPRAATQTFQGGTLVARIPRETLHGLQTLAREAGATLFMVLLAGYAALLGRYAGRTDVVIGTPVANRRASQTDGLIGFFANTLVIRLDLSGRPDMATLLARVRQVSLATFDHQDLPFERLVEELRPVRALSHSPLFQVLFVLQNAPAGRLVLEGLTLTPIRTETETAKFDLSLSITEDADGLEAAFEYNSHLFDRATVARMACHYANLLNAAVMWPQAPMMGLPMLAAAERLALLAEPATVAAPETVLSLFAAQARATPSLVAVRGQGAALDYAALDARSDAIAAALDGLGVRRGGRVAIHLERSTGLVAALLGVLKAGAACVPLDPALPAGRLAAILDDAAPDAALSEAALAGVLSPAAPVLLLEDIPPAASPALLPDPDAIAYMLYTSGSTGRPKGIAMPYAAFANLIAWQLAALPAAPGERSLQFASIGFDVAFQEIFATICGGGTLVMIADSDRRDPAVLLRVLGAEQVARLYVPFAALQPLAETAAALPEVPLALAHVIIAGEALRITPAIAALFARMPGCRLHNHYGPTETHVVTAFTLAGPVAEWPRLPPIGRAIANARLLVLDEEGEPVPAGVVGALHVGGVPLARGYVGMPALTADRFVPDPFARVPGSRLYCTGDLAAWRADGTLEYRGRADRQVKVRGLRVEVEEVEAVLGRLPGVAQLAVLPRKAGEGFDGLIAHVVPGDPPPSLAQVREHAQRLLPDAMVPVELRLHAALPLTASGKIDRLKLAEAAGSAAPAIEREPPRGPTEAGLAAIWADVLGVADVGRGDDFFTLGGHSLLAVQVASRIRGQLAAELPIRVLFESPVLSDLARRVDALCSVVGQLAAMPEDTATREEFVFE